MVSKYPKQRYEVEEKYTTMVDLASRACLPRVDMELLAKHLNRMECKMNPKFSEKYHWKADRFTDSGPMLRIESNLEGNISKVDRYANPYERPIYASGINDQDFEELVTCYFAFAHRNVTRKKDWEWAELHDFQNSIDWANWQASIPNHLNA